MAWRWESEPNTDDPAGYCGMACRPEMAELRIKELENQG